MRPTALPRSRKSAPKTNLWIEIYDSRIPRYSRESSSWRGLNLLCFGKGRLYFGGPWICDASSGIPNLSAILTKPGKEFAPIFRINWLR